MTLRRISRENSSAGDSAQWDQIWKRESHSYVSLQPARARSKIDAAINDGWKFNLGDRVLDVGCGTGHVLIEAAAQISSRCRFVACDISPTAAGLARTNFRDHGLSVDVICADAERLPLRENSIDKVLLLMTLQHVHDEAALLSEVDRVLARPGELFVAVPGERSIISMSYQLRRFVTAVPVDRRTFNLRRLLALVGSRFQIDGWQVAQVGADRWLSRAIDRTLARVIPEWGRYIMLRCSKPVIPAIDDHHRLG